MLYFSAALLSRAFGPLIALFTSPCGRHSKVAGRRRRSTRVRRYAPVPAPVEATSPPARTDRTTRTSELPKLPAPVPAARLAPPSERFPAEDIALVRPYYVARERELARTRAKATPRPHHRPHESLPPSGDLLATGPSPTPEPEPLPVPAPRAPSPACEDPDDWRTFTRLTRVWLDQQEQRTQQTQRTWQFQQSRQPQPWHSRQPQKPQQHHRQGVPA